MSDPKLNQQLFEKIFKEHLRIETYSESIERLLGPRRRSKIDYQPYYQRNYVWDDHKATYFIESILLGTEIPPLIFFYNNVTIEVIDGRQRFESIIRFHENQFPLTARGLTVLKMLKGCTYDSFRQNQGAMLDCFLDTKIRIIEFKLVNDPPLDPALEDRVKKEIFSRYNSGITPLKRSEVDDAIYTDNFLSICIKKRLSKDKPLAERLHATFFKERKISESAPSISELMGFIRRFLVLPLYPINRYAHGHDRTDILTRLYQKFSDDSVDKEVGIVKDFFNKTDFLYKVRALARERKTFENKLALECLLWGLGVLEQEGVVPEFTDELAQAMTEFLESNQDAFADESAVFRKAVATRFAKASEFFSMRYNVSFSPYISADDESRERFRRLREDADLLTRVEELEKLRLNKPEPSRNAIEDIIRSMQRNRFLVRPSYQRVEVINPAKMSAIIESVLLGITLPTLFLFKRKSGVSEVIDGQQRILTLLGFIAQGYIDENGVLTKSRNHGFALRNLRILRELEKLTFADLPENQQERIYDFPLYIVEIDEAQNPNFDPIDLFIRLNDKPFPIREHSFEMWNSWVDVDVIRELRNLTNSKKSWFFLKRLNSSRDRDRMENEELLTSLVYLEYLEAEEPNRKSLDVFQSAGKINTRLTNKAHLSSLLQHISEHPEAKERIIKAIRRTEALIQKLQTVLLDKDQEKDQRDEYLRHELDRMFGRSRPISNFKRSKQDFFFVWQILYSLNQEMVRHHRLKLKEDCLKIFDFIKNVPEPWNRSGAGLDEFWRRRDALRDEYSVQDRRVRLSDQMKKEMLERQSNKCGISGAPLFLGDDIEVDHVLPLALGGADDESNLQIAHKSENRRKGAKKNPKA